MEQYFLIFIGSHFTTFWEFKNEQNIMYKTLVPSAHKSVRIAKISILKLEGIIKKISYERRNYDSVDEKSLSWAMFRKNTKKKFRH